jgi:hypothetical protein
MKKIVFDEKAIDRVREVGIPQKNGFHLVDWDPERYLLIFANDTESEHKMRRIVKKRFVVREMRHDDTEDSWEVIFYVYLCKFTAWLDVWDWFEREECGCYKAGFKHWNGLSKPLKFIHRHFRREWYLVAHFLLKVGLKKSLTVYV